MALLNLAQDEIHLWFACPEEIRDPALLEAYHGLMNEKEAIQQKRFHFEKHRHQYLITRALVRSVLSKYAAIEPADWQFEKNKYGKPEIASHLDCSALRFNLTHTDGLIICGVTLEKDLGIDVENLTRQSETVGIANRFFSPQEVIDLNELPADQQKDRFFDYWTLGECYIKACGMGLSIPLDHFTFGVHEGQPLTVSFVPERNDNPQDWQFWLLKPSPKYKVAVGLRCDKKERAYQLNMRKTVPLAVEHPVSYPLLKKS